MIYLDSGILLKLYVNEPDANAWRDRLRAEKTEFVSSTLAIPEMRSAIRRKVQIGQLRKVVADEIWIEFQRNIQTQALATIPIGQEIIDGCIEILYRLPRRIPLRTLDALHLATARLLQPLVLATSDRRMIAGAHALGIPILSEAVHSGRTFGISYANATT